MAFFNTQAAPALSTIFDTITEANLPADTSALQIAALDTIESSYDGNLCHLAKTEAYEGLSPVSSHIERQDPTTTDGKIKIYPCPQRSISYIDWMFHQPF